MRERQYSDEASAENEKLVCFLFVFVQQKSRLNVILTRK